ncbi:MAG TPA: tRNA-uridine aminocarboxypropyltransferase [Pseudolabrys sp.]|nr:tRNA-uridine aminocarboxypropyltransferase [Pseudolabrys sp.]
MQIDAAHDASADCLRCGKPQVLCVCEGITPIDNRIEVMILQHPQEQDKSLGTARLTVLHLEHAALKIGLSWPNLSKLVGRPVEAQRWAVVYLGSVRAAAIAPDREIIAVNRRGEPLPNQDAVLHELEGIILLDGTWSQAKALWWRNAWMLKCRRIVLNPKRPSRYGRVRREPRRDALSTLESAALILSRLEKKPEIETALTASFEKLLARYRESGPSGKR